MLKGLLLRYESIILPVLILVFIGCIMVLSSSSSLNYVSPVNELVLFKRHLFSIGCGFIAIGVGYVFPLDKIKKYLPMAVMVLTFILILTVIPGIGIERGGASRWISLFSISFQPVEPFKIVFVMFLAFYIENKADKIKSLVWGIFPILIFSSIPLFALLLQPDLGNMGVILFVMIAILFLTQVSLVNLMAIVGIGILTLIFSLSSYNYQMDRLLSFFNPWEDPLGRGYHVIQSLTTVSLGGVTGVGIGSGSMKYSYLPYQYSDFIFSVLAEEGGFMLALFVVVLYFFFFLLGCRIAMNSQSIFSRYLCLGVVFLIVFQSYINIAVSLGLFPVTGIPLVFVSFGGTSLVSSLFSVGLIMNIGRNMTNKGVRK